MKCAGAGLPSTSPLWTSISNMFSPWTFIILHADFDGYRLLTTRMLAPHGINRYVSWSPIRARYRSTGTAGAPPLIHKMHAASILLADIQYDPVVITSRRTHA
jgi:hypothetical protein